MPLIAPSILASDWSRLADEVKAINEAGADYVHCDVMDGSFVPPITFGSDFVRAIHKVSKIPLDVHLMINFPEKHIAAFADAGASIITVHYEACPHLHRVIQQIHERGIKAGVAINPATPVDCLKDIVNEIDLLLIMSVNPGWGGQAFIPHSEQKLEQAAALIRASGRKVLLEVDGGINESTSKTAVKAGAEVLVAGSHIFNQKGKYAEAIASLR